MFKAKVLSCSHHQSENLIGKTLNFRVSSGFYSITAEGFSWDLKDLAFIGTPINKVENGATYIVRVRPNFWKIKSKISAPSVMHSMAGKLMMVVVHKKSGYTNGFYSTGNSYSWDTAWLNFKPSSPSYISVESLPKWFSQVLPAQSINNLDRMRKGPLSDNKVKNIMKELRRGYKSNPAKVLGVSLLIKDLWGIGGTGEEFQLKVADRGDRYLTTSARR